MDSGYQIPMPILYIDEANKLRELVAMTESYQSAIHLVCSHDERTTEVPRYTGIEQQFYVQLGV